MILAIVLAFFLPISSLFPEMTWDGRAAGAELEASDKKHEERYERIFSFIRDNENVWNWAGISQS